jgi:hypothetical protein
VVISGYTGETVSVAIPAAIGGRPVAGIGDRAFSGCTGLASVTIPASVISVDEGAFSDCGKLDKASRDSIGKRFGDGVF